MGPRNGLRFLVVAALAVVSANCVVASAYADDSPREQIGEVLGKPVYRDELRKDFPRVDELHRLFTSPVLAKYRMEHEKEIKPTEQELVTAQKFFDHAHAERIKDTAAGMRAELKQVEEQLAQKDLPEAEQKKLGLKKRRLEMQLNPPGRMFAEFTLTHWKFQRHLYDKFGGGRILWQQAGTEAFDAMRRWLETHEKNGSFKISDPELRKEFYHYWTVQQHGSFLTSDKERIRKTFLEPEWAAPGAKGEDEPTATPSDEKAEK
jgi:hypothetical protein